MPDIIRVGDSMSGKVSAHASHIIRYDTEYDEDGGSHQTPVYCSGHSVTGSQMKGSSKFFVGGKAIAVVGQEGTSDCPCDGKGFTISKGSSKFFVEGKAVAMSGSEVNIHGQGSGTMKASLNSKFTVR